MYLSVHGSYVCVIVCICQCMGLMSVWLYVFVSACVLRLCDVFVSAWAFSLSMSALICLWLYVSSWVFCLWFHVSVHGSYVCVIVCICHCMGLRSVIVSLHESYVCVIVCVCTCMCVCVHRSSVCDCVTAWVFCLCDCIPVCVPVCGSSVCECMCSCKGLLSVWLYSCVFVCASVWVFCLWVYVFMQGSPVCVIHWLYGCVSTWVCHLSKNVHVSTWVFCLCVSTWVFCLCVSTWVFCLPVWMYQCIGCLPACQFIGLIVSVYGSSICQVKSKYF